MTCENIQRSYRQSVQLFRALHGHSRSICRQKNWNFCIFLPSSPNQVFTREQLLDHIWGYEYIGDTRTVDVHIKRLREKIKDHDYMEPCHRLGHWL